MRCAGPVSPGPPVNSCTHHPLSCHHARQLQAAVTRVALLLQRLSAALLLILSITSRRFHSRSWSRCHAAQRHKVVARCAAPPCVFLLQQLSTKSARGVYELDLKWQQLIRVTRGAIERCRRLQRQISAHSRCRYQSTYIQLYRVSTTNDYTMYFTLMFASCCRRRAPASSCLHSRRPTQQC